ncbi:MAG: hypothetical protein ACEQSR_12320 [Candidatus Methylacidiphilales bacterium]
MKYFVIVILISLLTQLANAQTETEQKLPAFYLGTGTGINNNCGAVGFKLGIRLNNKMILDAGVGLGTWGSKTSLGLVFNAINKNAWCPFLSISRASGLENIKLDLEVKDQFDKTSEKNIELNINPATTFNIGVQRQWIRKSGNRMVLDLGFSILVDGGSHEMLDYTNQLTNDGKKKLNAFRPGGLMIGFSYNFGVN